MKKIILLFSLMVSSVSSAQLLSKPAVLHLNGEQTLDLIVIADGGTYSNQQGTCEFYIEQNGEVLTSANRKVNGHTAFIRSAKLKEGYAEFYIRCEGPVKMYLVVVGEQLTRTIFNTNSEDPNTPYKLQHNEFRRILRIVQ